MIKSFDTFFISARISRSNTLSVTGYGLIVFPISSAAACLLMSSNEALNDFTLKSTFNMKDFRREHNKPEIVLILYKGKVRKIIYMRKKNMKLQVIFLQNTGMKEERFFF